MIATILMIYGAAGLAYWMIQAIRQTPTILRWMLFVLALPILLPVTLVKSLPFYLKKGDKWYGYRWLVYFTFTMIVVNIILFCLPA